MSVDSLQEKIRKKKNPTMLLLACGEGELPPQLSPEKTKAQRYAVYYKAVLEELKDLVPAVRVSFSAFAMLGAEGLMELPEVLKTAANLGYYVVLDAPQMLSAQAANQTARALFAEENPYGFDALVIPSYLGSDIMKPFLTASKKQKKDLFVVARTGNRSASEMQDLLTGSRLVHMAAADHVNRYAGDSIGRHGFSQLGILAGASSADSLRLLRSTYPQLVMLLDGGDDPNANAKNCSNAFDRFGHGAAACIGSSVLEAWLKEPEADWQPQIRAAAERMKKNMNRYLIIL